MSAIPPLTVFIITGISCDDEVVSELLVNRATSTH